MGGLRIAIVASTLEVGGAERVVELLVPRLERRGHAVVVDVLREPGAVGRRMIAAGVRVRCRRGGGRRAVAGAVALARTYRRERPDVVLCLDHHDAMFAGRVAGIVSRTRAIVVASHATGLVGRRSALRRSDRWLMDATDCVVALSPAHARYLREREAVDAARVAVIPNGIDVEAFAGGDPDAARRDLGLEPSERAVVMVAALRPEKAHEAFVDAIARLRAAGWPVRGLIVGEGPRRAAVEAAIAASGVADRIAMLGRRDDVARILRAADALVLPSHDVVETLPLVVLEAMAAGVPVVASAVGSVPDVVRRGETGWTIPPADGAAAARALREVFADAARTREITRRAHEMVTRRFGADRMADDYDRLLRELVNA